MFYMPEALIDSELPKWCNENPYVFMVQHRDILESPQISVSLNSWIDMTFGAN